MTKKQVPESATCRLSSQESLTLTIGARRANASSCHSSQAHSPAGKRPYRSLDKGLALILTRRLSSYHSLAIRTSEVQMDQVKGYYKSLSVGMAIGVLTTSFLFAHAMLRPRACEPVVDVE